LLHLVDIAPIDGTDPADTVKAIANELVKFSEDLADKRRWLVINKIDLLSADEQAKAVQELLRKLDWKGRAFEISAATGEGTQLLGQAVMRQLEEIAEEAG
jgi:GTP-binding protein